MEQIHKLPAWRALENHAKIMRQSTYHDLVNNQTERQRAFQFSCQNIHIDLSKQRMNDTTLKLLMTLADECHLREKINALFRGDVVNYSEMRPALHTALRNMNNQPLYVDNVNIALEIQNTLLKIQQISERIRTKQWLGYSGKPIKDIVHIGIGGSDLAPRLCINALAEYVSSDLGYYFIADADPIGFDHIVKKVSPETTIFIIASKTFTTVETLYNAKKAMDWFDNPGHIEHHFIAVTARVEIPQQFGIKHILPIWDWVGGRYSLCSAINLITAIAIGFAQFMQILSGANAMDNHFREADFKENLPFLLAMAGIWNNNFLGINNLLFLIYCQQLEFFLPYVQQLDMESNGKSVDNQGNFVKYSTGPIVWGGLGNQAQHSYYQLLFQGTHAITADFITLKSLDGHMLNTMCYEKMRVLSEGVYLHDNSSCIPGNMPFNHIHIEHCTPNSIGALIALYEHKIFCQGVIWNINSFDQPGVESSKVRVT